MELPFISSTQSFRIIFNCIIFKEHWPISSLISQADLESFFVELVSDPSSWSPRSWRKWTNSSQSCPLARARFPYALYFRNRFVIKCSNITSSYPYLQDVYKGIHFLAQPKVDFHEAFFHRFEDPVRSILPNSIFKNSDLNLLWGTFPVCYCLLWWFESLHAPQTCDYIF